MTDQVRNSPACSEPPSRPPLCVMGCGFFGNPRTDNMCSVCHRKATQNANLVTATSTSNAAMNTTPSPPSSSPSDSPTATSIPVPTSITSSSNLTISTPNTLPMQALSPLTPIQRAPAPSPFSMSLADPLPDSLSVPFMEPFVEPRDTDASSTVVALSNFQETPQPTTIKIEAPIATVAIPSPEKLATPAPAKPTKSRCKVCSRKVGLAYFNCKCDENAMFCSSHRYPHAHSCTHSHRTDQQEKLAKANPIVKNDQFERL